MLSGKGPLVAYLTLYYPVGQMAIYRTGGKFDFRLSLSLGSAEERTEAGNQAYAGGRGFKPWPNQHSGALNNRVVRKCCLCNDICQNS